MKEVSGRKVELDEVTVPAPLLESSSSEKSVQTTPYELWFGKKPKLSYLKVWG